MSNPGTHARDSDQREDGSAAATLSNLVRDLVEQLATANAKVLDLGTKCAALQKELEMHKEYQYQVVEHAVEKAKRDWDRHWQQLEEIEEQARRSVASQPEAKPSPAPGFEAQQRGPEPAAPDFEAPQPGPPPTAQGIIFHPPKAAVEAEPQETKAPEPAGIQEAFVVKPDPWAVALATPKVGVCGGIDLHTDELAGETPVFGEPLRNPHPKEFDRPKQYSGSADN